MKFYSIALMCLLFIQSGFSQEIDVTSQEIEERKNSLITNGAVTAFGGVATGITGYHIKGGERTMIAGLLLGVLGMGAISGTGYIDEQLLDEQERAVLEKEYKLLSKLAKLQLKIGVIPPNRDYMAIAGEVVCDNCDDIERNSLTANLIITADIAVENKDRCHVVRKFRGQRANGDIAYNLFKVGRFLKNNN